MTATCSDRNLDERTPAFIQVHSIRLLSHLQEQHRAAFNLHVVFF